MAAYTFLPEHRPLILDGAKDFTIRRIGDKRHAEVGDVVEFDEGDVTYARVICTFRARIAFTDTALLRVLDPRYRPVGEALHRLFQASEQGAYKAGETLPFLAQRDGFNDWAGLHAFHLAQQKRPLARLNREVIGWSPASVVAL